MINNLPLSGVKVVSLCSFVAGTTTSRFFSEFGADVVQIETLKGDPWRFQGPKNNVPANDVENELFDIWNAHKRCICLDMRTAEGKEVFFRLLEKADVFITSNRLQALEKLGIDYDSIKDRFPKLVYGILTGYGSKGPEAEKPGYDGVTFFANSGLSVDTVAPGASPINPPPCGGDVFAGTILFGGVMTALYAAKMTGKGDLIESSLYGSAIWMSSMTSLITQPRFNEAFPKERARNKPVNTSYRCKDGEWITLWVLEYNRYREKIFEALGIPEIASDPRFADVLSMQKNGAAIIEIFEKAFAKFDSKDIMQRFSERDITAAYVKHYKNLHTDPQALANDFMREVTYANGNKAVLPMIPVKSRNAGIVPFEKAPTLGENTAEVLKELNYTEEELQTMREKKIIN